MAIQKRKLKNGTYAYRARLRGPDGSERSKQYRTKREASAWEATQKANILTGAYVDPRRGSTTFGAWACGVRKLDRGLLVGLSRPG